MQNGYKVTFEVPHEEPMEVRTLLIAEVSLRLFHDHRISLYKDFRPVEAGPNVVSFTATMVSEGHANAIFNTIRLVTSKVKLDVIAADRKEVLDWLNP